MGIKDLKPNPKKSFCTTKEKGYYFCVRNADSNLIVGRDGKPTMSEGKKAVYTTIPFNMMYDPDVVVNINSELSENDITADELRKKCVELAGTGSKSTPAVWEWKDRPAPQKEKDLETALHDERSENKNLKAEIEALRGKLKKGPASKPVNSAASN